MIEPHQVRVMEERNHLMDKLQRLNSFVDSSTFHCLPFNEKDVLQRQRVAMAQYLSLLNERIGSWTTSTV